MPLRQGLRHTGRVTSCVTARRDGRCVAQLTQRHLTSSRATTRDAPHCEPRLRPDKIVTVMLQTIFAEDPAHVFQIRGNKHHIAAMNERSAQPNTWFSLPQ